jgi:hypothetical protein
VSHLEAEDEMPVASHDAKTCPISLTARAKAGAPPLQRLIAIALIFL